MAGIGDNLPPGQIEFTSDTSLILGAFLKDHPVILTEEEARAAKLLIDRAVACVKDLEAERDGKVRPLNMQVKAINDEYRPYRATLERVTQELLVRIDGYRKVEEDKRRKIAEETKRAAEEAEHRAREAEQREREARSDAEVGVESDIGTAIVETDLAVAEAEKAAHRAALAEKESKVRIGGGFGRVLTARTQETLILVDPLLAIKLDIGWTQRIKDAILSEAREFRKRWNRLPSGVESHVERSMTKKGQADESL